MSNTGFPLPNTTAPIATDAGQRDVIFPAT